MEINVVKGQGITQAIAANLGLDKDDCKGIKLSTWQSVMTLVDEANTKRIQNNQSSIFTGGNDVKSIGDSASWKSNFKVNAGDVMHIEDSIFDKIRQLLTGKSTAEVAQESTQATQQTEEVESEEFIQGQKISDKFKEMSDFDENGNVKNISLEITNDEWRQLASKKDKTEAEKQQLDTEYKQAVHNTGFAYHAYIDKAFGDNNGLIDAKEYEAFEYEGIPEELKADEEVMQQIKEMNNIAFNRLDLNKDGQIDYQELSAYIYAMDFGTEDGKSNGLNGKISAFDFMTNSLALSKAEKSKLDEKLVYAYNALFGKKVA